VAGAAVRALYPGRMGRIVVDVMPKPEILDPQGQAVAAALPRLGLTGFTGVRQGKRFELEVDGEVTAEVLEAATRAATTLLSNPVIEDVVRVAAAAPSHADGEADDAAAADAPHDPGAHEQVAPQDAQEQVAR
jgi:phosphoribosylformylglycinamidine synthase PurS subunit